VIAQAHASAVRNLSFLIAFKTVPNALHILASQEDNKIDAFICPAHVSAIIGAKAYEPLVERFKLPAVIAGFEPLDILGGIAAILEQLAAGKPRVENLYARVVKDQGNVKAQNLMAEYLEEVDTPWRGLGVLPQSGLSLKPAYAGLDAERRYGIKIQPGKVREGCRCKDVLRGVIKPPECALFGNRCTPLEAVGPCMVSSEGSCAAYYKYDSWPAL
jgi:hydrogenase expression/formation protein HypD